MNVWCILSRFLMGAQLTDCIFKSFLFFSSCLPGCYKMRGSTRANDAEIRRLMLSRKTAAVGLQPELTAGKRKKKKTTDDSWWCKAFRFLKRCSIWIEILNPPFCLYLWVFMNVCVCRITSTGFLVLLQHPGDAAADRSARPAGADLITSAVALFTPVRFWGGRRG